MEQQYNLRSPAVKRLMREARELREPTHQYHAQPLEDNLFEWHFTVAGASDSAFDGGRYHGRIILPSEYPMKPPHIIVLTPNGRFIVGHKICLSVSGYHPETWQPSWSIRTVLLALIGFMPTKGEGAIGALDYTDQERVKLAKRSVNFVCPTCGLRGGDALPDRPEGQSALSAEDEALAAQISFKGAKSATSTSSSPAQPDASNKSSCTTKAAAAASEVSTSAEPTPSGSSTSASDASVAADDRGSGPAPSSAQSPAQSGTRQRKPGKAKGASAGALPRSAAVAERQTHAFDWIWTVLVYLLVLTLVGLGVRRLFFL
ncbi:ubiquitin-conjugating enzyme E2 J1-like [Sycon ciliatum]|uniref:ubiquitin-conjugating enzyme E2 J1-like n=1 Tax=Sycon ciliatum TaxID=27933 RepID=UPI0031F632A7